MAAVAIVVATVVVVGQVTLFVVVVVAVFAPYAFFLSVFQRLLRSRFDFLSILSFSLCGLASCACCQSDKKNFSNCRLGDKIAKEK